MYTAAYTVASFVVQIHNPLIFFIFFDMPCRSNSQFRFFHVLEFVLQDTFKAIGF